MAGLRRPWTALGVATTIVITRTDTVASVQSQLSAIIDRVRATYERVVVTKDGVPAVALVSAEDLESTEETLAVVADDATMRMLDQAEAEVSAESTMTADGLSHLLAATHTRDAYR